MESVEPQPCSFSKKRSIVCAENQGEMSYEGAPVKALPSTRKKDDAAHATANFTSGSGGTTKYLEHSGKNGNCGNGELPGQQ